MKSETTIFIGAGATRDLGMPTTNQQDELFGSFLFAKTEEVCFADETVHKFLEKDELSKIYRQFNDKSTCTDYDIPGLRKYVRHFFTKESFTVMGLYNLIDMQIRLGQACTIMNGKDPKTVRPEEMVLYRRGMLVLLQSIFSICQRKALNDKNASKYVHFFEEIAKIVLQDKLKELEAKQDLTSHDFIFSKLAYASTNWDILFLWFVFQAHRNLNNRNINYIVSSGKNLKLKIFNDFSTFMAAKLLKPESEDTKSKRWYPYNESVAVRVNDEEHLYDRCVTLIHTYLPHGQTNWLQCPVCGKLSMYLGDSWDLNSATLPMKNPGLEKDPFYKCVHCGQKMTTADSSMLLQTVIKNKASYIEEVQRDMRLQLWKSKRLIFIGYSLPQDDVEYQSIFASENDKDHRKDAFVVLHQKGEKSEWLSFDDARKRVEENHELTETIKRYAKLFGESHVKINFAGFPAAADKILEILKD